MTEPIAPERGVAPPRGGPRRRPLVLGLVALLALGGAGLSIYLTSGEEIRLEAGRIWAEWHKPAPPTPEQLAKVAAQAAQAEAERNNRPIGDDEPAYWSEVALFRAGPNRPRPVVVVRRAEWSGPENLGSLRGLVTRELFRQGLIMALREGTDAVVRDRMTGDPDEPGTPDAAVRLGSILQSVDNRPFESPLGGRVALVEGRGPDRRVLFSRYLKVPIQNAPHYGSVVGEIEKLVAVDLREGLAAWKLPPSRMPRTPVEPDALPEGAAARLASLSEFDQVVGLRALHEAVRRDGASLRRLFALADGYAMLGSLTEPLPSATHAAFKARALLYAQRAFLLAKEDPRSFRDQAFAETLSGLIKEGKGEYVEADKRDGGKGTNSRDEILRAFLALDLGRLDQLARRSPDDPLPLYLHAVAAQRALNGDSNGNRGSLHEVIAAQDRLLARYPECNRAIDNLCEANGVSNLHRSTLLGMQALAATTSRRVRDLPGVPPAVLDRARSEEPGADEVALRRALDEAASTDTGDLSWGTLAQILRETRFWQVARRIYFEAIPLGVSPQEFAATARPMVADHPNREYLDLFAGSLDPMSAIKLYRRLDWDGMETKNCFVLSVGAVFFDPGSKDETWRQARSRADLGLVPNMERNLRYTSPDGRPAQAGSLIHFDPTSPLARATLAGADWKANGPKALDWEREQPWNTLLKAEIGFQLLKEKRQAEAQGRFEEALARSPEAWIFDGLAQAYAARGQTEEYLRAAQVMLQQEDQDLDHARIAEKVAQYLMNRGRVDDAWPWAERAALSWANWTMATAWKCAEMRRDWANAETWVSRQSGRYGQEWLNWLTWSLRTGHGHVPRAARAVWMQYDAGRAGRDVAEDLLLADLGLVTDRPDATRAIAERSLVDDPNSLAHATLLVLACDRLGDRKARDEALDRITTNPKPSGPRTAKSIALLADWDRHREAQELADVLKRVDAILAEIPAENRPNTEFVVGSFLAMFGRPAEALPYLKRADVDGCAMGARLIARHLLAAQNQPLTDFLFNPPAAPKAGEAPDEPVSF